MSTNKDHQSSSLFNSMQYVPSLDGLRGLACILVLLFHAQFSWAKGGFIGVEVFFVLSGYLITSILLSEKNQLGKIQLKRFYVNRVLRLLPILYAMMSMYLFLVLVVAEHNESRWNSFGEFLNTILFIKNLPIALQGYNTLFMHTWSLCVEWQFYMFWPFVLVFFFGMKNGFIRVMLLLGAILFFPLNREFGYLFWDLKMEGILFGVLLAFLFEMKSKLLLWLAKRQYLTLLSLFFLLSIVYFIHISEVSFYKWSGVIVGVFSFVVINSLLNREKSFLSCVFEWKVLTFTGKISYGLYLFHYPIFRYVKYQYEPIIILLVFGGLSYILAVLSYLFFEKPILMRYKIK